MKKIIEIKNLTKEFRKKVVLNKINLDIFQSDRLAIVGSNGAGKTTLVDIISFSVKKTSGTINYNFTQKNSKSIGIQYQESQWPPGISANDVIKFNRKLKNNLSHIDKLINVFEIKDFLKMQLCKLSSGQKQRFNALLSVISDPELLILDELSSGLDMNIQFKIIEFLKAYFKEKNKTLIIISHNSEEIELLANRVVILNKGKIFLDLPMKDITKKWGSVRELMIKYFKGDLKHEKF